MPKLKYKLRFLFSWPYLRKNKRFFETVKAIMPYCDVMLDSGAHTNYEIEMRALRGRPHSMVEIKVEDYCEAVKRYFEGRAFQYINLDRISDPETSMSNYDYLRENGLQPMPVYVSGMSMEQVRQFLADTKYVCVAGGVGGKDDYVIKRYTETFELSGGSALVHALGFSRHHLVRHLPIYTMDSAAWKYGQISGRIGMFNPREERMELPRWQHIMSKDPKYKEKRKRVLRFLMDKCNVRVEDLNRKKTWHWELGIPSMTSMSNYLLYAEALRKRGRHYFFAVSNYRWFAILLAAFDNVNFETGEFDWPGAIRDSTAFTGISMKRFVIRCVSIIQRVSDRMPDYDVEERVEWKRPVNSLSS